MDVNRLTVFILSPCFLFGSKVPQCEVNMSKGFLYSTINALMFFNRVTVDTAVTTRLVAPHF